MFFVVFNPDDVAPPTAHFAWATGRSLIDTTDGTPDDGDRLTLITDTSAAAADAVQSTSGDRPTWRPADFPGRGGIEVVNGRHMKAPVTPTLRWALVICDGANRGWLARDTSATTDSPAFSLRVSEDFG
jgi:hypothetical protein